MGPSDVSPAPPPALPRPSSCSRCCPGDVQPRGHVTLELHSSGDTQPWGCKETEHSDNAAKGWGPLSQFTKPALNEARCPLGPRHPCALQAPGFVQKTPKSESQGWVFQRHGITGSRFSFLSPHPLQGPVSLSAQASRRAAGHQDTASPFPRAAPRDSSLPTDPLFPKAVRPPAPAGSSH